VARINTGRCEDVKSEPRCRPAGHHGGQRLGPGSSVRHRSHADCLHWIAAIGSVLLMGLQPGISRCAATGKAPLVGDVTMERMEADAQSGKNWLMYGRTYSEQRFSPLKDINETTVRRLGLAWSTDIPSRDGLGATPIEVDGVIYLSGSRGLVEALDARDGHELWRFRADPPATAHLFSAWTSRSNRGVAVWGGRVFFGTGDCRLIALDAASGHKIWDVQNCNTDAGYGSTGAPRIAKDMVLIGNSGADAGARGYVSAYDSHTGRLIWRFFTVPGDPANGFEQPILERAARTWSGEAWWKSGGGTAWDSIVYDPELDQIYFGTDSALPWNSEVRNPQGGDNWFTNSIVAVDAKTGRYRWHYQEVPADAWDYNATPSIILTSLRIEGHERPVLMQAPKDGFFYVIDRRDGRLISAKPFVKVTWASKINLTTGRPVEAPDARYYRNKTHRATIFPSIDGGHNWQSMSFSPLTGLAYIPALDAPATFYTIDGTERGEAWAEFYTPAANVRPQPSGQLIAWDPVTQHARWSVPLKYPFNGGTLVTAGNLVFQGTAEGDFTARRASDGTLLWHMLVVSATQAPPVTYFYEGKQYVLLPVGASGAVRAYIPQWGAPESAQGPSRLLAFALDSTGSIPPGLLTKPPLPKPPLQFASMDIVAKGGTLYQRAACVTCHGVNLNVAAGGSAPDLRYLSPEVHAIWDDVVLDGELQAAGMPSFKGELSESDAQAIRAYVIDEALKLYRSTHAELPVAQSGVGSTH
jgi:quinohemoprotein ethanol dehydrogenase